MLLLRFQLGDNRYALDAQQLIEVVPLVQMEPIPKAPPFVTGLFNYRGELIPVIDLARLVTDLNARQRMTTRILLVNYPLEDGGSHLLGLLAEQVTETFKCSPEQFRSSGVRISETPYLGDMVQDDKGIIHFLALEHLLPEPVKALLFHQDAA